MPLSTGARLGPYGIVSALGAGGMGEVYRARHRLARFRREAQVLASLNHPNIAQIYGFRRQRFLINTVEETATSPITLVLNRRPGAR